jgi:hypothetical protein
MRVTAAPHAHSDASRHHQSTTSSEMHADTKILGAIGGACGQKRTCEPNGIGLRRRASRGASIGTDGGVWGDMSWPEEEGDDKGNSKLQERGKGARVRVSTNGGRMNGVGGLARGACPV